MIDFTLEKAATITDAVTKIAHPQTKFIGGGTNLIDLMKETVENPRNLVDITQLDMKTIRQTNEGLHIGALVTNNDVAYHPLVEQNYPLLSRAILAGASPQLRNMATTGGNLLQRTRCYYFFDVHTPCNKREPGSGCAALTGLNRIHAILGHSKNCIAVHPSDMCVALRSLDAVVHVQGPKGKRDIPFEDFHRLPGDEPQKDNTLAPDELITGLTLPTKIFKTVNYLKVRDRASYSFAIVSVAVALELEGSSIKDARVSLGGVAHKPWRDPVLEQKLIGKKATNASFSEFAQSLLSSAEGFEHNSFKINLASRAIVKAMREATAGTPS